VADIPNRKIIHIDCDCFYAAVEVRDNSALLGLPVVVGGLPGKRGVVAACNYEARKYGVHSAMPSSRAQKLCPDLRFITPDIKKYQLVSSQIHSIFQRYTDLIEPLSLDEAYLDVSDSLQCQGSATLIAQRIRSEIKNEINITASAGIAPNKFLAKIASDWNKPNGLFVVRPDDIDQFLIKLPVSKLFGVGKVTASKMLSMGIETCGDLKEFSLVDLHRRFGQFGSRLYELARGNDNRPVKTERERKSISVERTFDQDISDQALISAELKLLWERLDLRISQKEENRPVSKIVLKLKYSDFVQTTIERSAKSDLGSDSYEPLLAEAMVRRSSAIRLLGIGVRFKERTLQHKQLTLW